ncbi:DUF1524 domain-containing protein [Streptomyces sp. NPDC056683]|uniref:GmrSD restriction endonuclease domain-containing protein n=1 Tax=Streptomyces sp. NPDC056683 TaxID=3345910 RepID=UPI00367B1B2C
MNGQPENPARHQTRPDESPDTPIRDYCSSRQGRAATPPQLDVDRLVPLAEAGDSGASPWTAKEHEAYANDLDDPRALIAVSAASNRSKTDKDPTEWLPPYSLYRCTYVTNRVADKTRYQLSVDPAESERRAG